MKQLILIFVLSIALFTCSTKQGLKEYINKETFNNKEAGISTILFNRKPSSITSFSTYSAINYFNNKHFSKTFSQVDYDSLNKLSKKDTIAEYWTEKESKKFGFQEITFGGYGNHIKLLDLEKKYNGKLIFYNLSNPLYLKSNKTIIFLVTKSKGLLSSLENAVVVMKKENGKWQFVEKVYSQVEY